LLADLDSQTDTGVDIRIMTNIKTKLNVNRIAKVSEEQRPSLSNTAVLIYQL